jgi:hypothetical protein
MFFVCIRQTGHAGRVFLDVTQPWFVLSSLKPLFVKHFIAYRPTSKRGNLKIINNHLSIIDSFFFGCLPAFFAAHVQSFVGLPQPEHTLFLIGLPHTLHGEHPHAWHIVRPPENQCRL